MSKNLVILGSCVSRDPFEFHDLSQALLYFHCRSNIASLVNTDPFRREIHLEGLTPFQRRCAKQDLEKTFRTDFENCIVLFDFIDDRFPVATNSEGVFSYNPVVARLNPKIYQGMTITRHFEKSNWIMVEKWIELFADRFSELFSKNATVLHTANFSPFYDGGSSDAEYCSLMRKYYDFLFDTLCKHMRFDHVIDCMGTIVDAESTPRDHRWGHAPFHYHDTYNRCVAEKITRIRAEEMKTL